MEDPIISNKMKENKKINIKNKISDLVKCLKGVKIIINKILIIYIMTMYIPLTSMICLKIKTMINNKNMIIMIQILIILNPLIEANKALI